MKISVLKLCPDLKYFEFEDASWTYVNLEKNIDNLSLVISGCLVSRIDTLALS